MSVARIALFALLVGLLCSGLGFGTARLLLAPSLEAHFETPLHSVLLSGSTDQIRRRFHLGLTPEERVALGEPRPPGLDGESASVLELLATRGDGDLVGIALGEAEQVDPETLLASLCVSARLGHRSQIERISSLLPAVRRTGATHCLPEDLPASALALEHGHGGTARLLSDEGL